MKRRMSLCLRQRKEMKDKHMIMTTTTNQNMSISNLAMSSRNPILNITKSSMNHQCSHPSIMFQLTPINIRKI
ncbi:hypothetical protein PIB30_116099, partial [Stylosanthes scabra]|nr:hypothetical protein [Stylosanthes scabra]